MSSINTNGIDGNYPVPGVNNNSQGFRDNFSAIKTNLNVAASEISDLQGKVVLKQALTDTTLNNDMAGTLISNALTRSFSATTYNLGGSLSGKVVINVSLGDVQYGTLSANTQLQFNNWTSYGYQSFILSLNISNSSAVLSFPAANVMMDNSSGVISLENYANVANTPTVTFPYNVANVDYKISSIDCGATIIIEPINRPRKISQIQVRTPSPNGFKGDVPGTVCADSNYFYVCTSTFNSTIVEKIVSQTSVTSNEIKLNSLTSLTLNSPIIFTGTVLGGIVADKVYYIKTIVSGNTAITVSDTRVAGLAGTTVSLTSATGTFFANSYNGTSIWKKTELETW